MTFPGYKIVETLVVRSRDPKTNTEQGAPYVTNVVNSVTRATQHGFWQPLGEVVRDGDGYMQTVVRLEKLPERMVVKFRVVVASGKHELLSDLVQQELAKGWQPFGPIATNSYTKKIEGVQTLIVEYIQTLVQYD